MSGSLSCGIAVPAGTAVIVVPSAPPGGARTYQRIINVGTSTGAVAWLARGVSPAAITSPQFLINFGPNKPGCFPLAPYGNTAGMPSAEEFDGPAPQGCTVAISDGGTSGTAPALLTWETYP